MIGLSSVYCNCKPQEQFYDFYRWVSGSFSPLALLDPPLIHVHKRSNNKTIVIVLSEYAQYLSMGPNLYFMKYRIYLFSFIHLVLYDTHLTPKSRYIVNIVYLVKIRCFYVMHQSVKFCTKI